MERQKIVTRLQKYKVDRMVASGTDYDGTKAWVDNAFHMHNMSKVERLIVYKIPCGTDPSIPIATPEDMEEDFLAFPREIQIENDARSLCGVAETLVASSSFVIFVDPYMKIYSNSPHLTTIAEFASLASRTGKCHEFIMYSRKEWVPKGGEKEVIFALESAMRKCVPTGFMVTVRYIEDDESKDSHQPKPKSRVQDDRTYQLADWPQANEQPDHE